MATIKPPKPLDILKAGPQSYRQLQDANMQSVTGVSPDFMEYLNKFNIAPISQFDARIDAEQDVASPFVGQETHTGKPDFWGNSFFDAKEANENQFQHLGDIRADNQPWYSKVANGVGKAGVLAVTTAVEGLGMIYGALGQGIYNAVTEEGDAGDKAREWFRGVWDNPITNALQTINDYSEEYLPNYYTESEQSHPLTAESIFSANFLGDKLLKNFGFMVGAYYGGLPVAKAIGKVGVNAVKAARAADLAERAGMAKRVAALTEEAAGDAKKLEKLLAAEHLTEAERGKRMLESMNNVASIANTTRHTSQVVGAFGSALNEGAIEAINNSKDWAKLQNKKEDDRFQKELADAYDVIEQTYGGTEMEMPLKIQARREAEEKHNEILAEIEKGRARMGNADMLLNIPILTASNFIQWGRLYGRGFDSTRREMGSLFNGHKLAKDAEKGYHTTMNRKKGILTALAKSNSEGLEEYLQRAASDGTGNAVADAIDRHFSMGQSEESQVDVGDYIAQFGKAIADNAGDPSAWEEYLIGAMSSAIGMPVFGSQTKNAYIGKGGPVGLAGGLWGEYSDYMDRKKHEEDVANYLNERTTGKLAQSRKALYDGLRKSRDFEKLLYDALFNEDKEKYKTLEAEKLFDDINMFASAGRLEDFKQLVGYVDDFTDEELQDIIDTTSQKVSADDQKKRDEVQIKALTAAINEAESTGNFAQAAVYRDQLAPIQERYDRDDYKDTLVGPYVENGMPMNLIPDVDEKGHTIEGTEGNKMKKILEENRQRLLDGINSFLKIRNDIDIETDGNLDDKQIALLSKLRFGMLDFDRRSAEMTEDVVNKLRTINIDKENIEKEYKKVAEEKKEALKKAKDNLAKAKAENKGEDIIKALTAKEENAKKELDSAQNALLRFSAFASLFERITKRKEMTSAERDAMQRGYEQGSTAAGRRSHIPESELEDRNVNVDELLGMLHSEGNKKALQKLILSDPNMDNVTKANLFLELNDLNKLAQKKSEYNQEVRKMLNDPSLINEISKAHEDKAIQAEKNNKTKELALQVQNVKNIQELDRLLNDINSDVDIYRAVLEKVLAEGSEDFKKMLNDYLEGSNFLHEVQAAIFKEKDDTGFIQNKMLEWAFNSFDAALEKGSDIKKTFIDGMKSLINENKDNEELPIDKAAARRLNKILSSLTSAENATSTRKTKEVAETGSLAAVKKAKEAEKERKKKKEEETTTPEPESTEPEGATVSIEDVEKAIRKDVENILKSGEGVDGIDNLSKETKKLIDKYKEENKDNEDAVVIDDDYLVEIVDAVSEEIIAADNKAMALSTEEEGEDPFEDTQKEEMQKEVRVTYKSDRITEYDNHSPEEKEEYVPDTPQGKAIQALLKELKAYSFIDHNLLGYLMDSDSEYPTLHFLRSTDPNVDGETDAQTPVFIAIKIGSEEEENIRRKACGGNKEVSLSDRMNLITVGDSQYQIIGVLTYAADASDDVQQAFGNMLESFVKDTNDAFQFENEKESGKAPFVLWGKTSRISQIFTGRLEKTEGELEEDGKVSLYTLMADTTEWSGGKMPFYFGIAVDGEMNVDDDITTGTRLEVVNPNSSWVNTHNGHIVLYVPKPNGKQYPIRCTRRTVGDWMDKTDNEAGLTGEEFLKRLLDSKSGVKNAYLQTVINYIKDLFNEEASLGKRTQAKMMLHKFFILGENHSISFDEEDRSVRLFDQEVDPETIEDDSLSEEEKEVLAFFKVLAENNVLFSIPTSTFLNIPGREIIKAGVLEVGLRSFYNFNANFTVEPIDGNGDPVSSEAPVVIPSTPGGPNPKVYTVDFNDGKGEKNYLIDRDGKVFLIEKKDDKEVRVAVTGNTAVLVTLSQKVQKGEVPTALDALYPEMDPKVKEEVLKKDPNIDKIYIYEGPDGIKWVYNANYSNHTRRLYKLDGEHGKKTSERINKAQLKVAATSLSAIMKKKPSSKNTLKSSSEVTVSENPIIEEEKKPTPKPEGKTNPKNLVVGKELSEMTAGDGLIVDTLQTLAKPLQKNIFSLLQLAEANGKLLSLDDTDINTKIEDIQKALEAGDTEAAQKMLETWKHEIECK